MQVAYKFGVDTHNLLKEAGADITFKTYNGMAHSVSRAQSTA
jgi:predicted esterase